MDNKHKGQRDEEPAPEFIAENKRVKRIKTYEKAGTDLNIKCYSNPWEVMGDPFHNYGIVATTDKDDNPYRYGTDEWRAYNFGGMRSRYLTGKASRWAFKPNYEISNPE